jgi:predicted CopG family antitoxin
MVLNSHETKLHYKKRMKLIKVDPEVHRKLTELTEWGDTLSNVINKLIDEHNARVKKEKGK